MAEKGFGAKEINLIGSSGTPTIESPGNLNLNANNVAISTNVSIGGTLSVTGNVSVGGTLTYEDVTNIDSVGLITARSGVSVTSGGIQVLAGVSRFNANIIGTATTAISVTTADESSDTSCNVLFATAATGNIAPKTGTNLTFNSSNGTLTATTFSGSGASLTNLPAANITGTLPAISGANLTGIAVTEAPAADYTITSPTDSYYLFHGGGVDVTSQNPTLYLERGKKYRFNNTTGSSHPFEFRNQANNADYTDGITGSQNGVQFFTVPLDAPNQIKYRCTIHTGSMIGDIYINGGQYQTRSNNLCLQYTKSSSNVTSGTVIYDTEVFDVGDSNAYNTSNGEFTAPVTGVYRIQYEHFASGEGRATAAIQKHDGSSWSTVKNGMRVYSVTSGSNWSSVPTIFYLQLNATEKFKIIHLEGTIHLNTPWNHLTVQLVQ